MKLFSTCAALSSTLFFSSTLARYGLSPDTIPMLTRTVDYTFHTICDNFHNPVPSPMFDEMELASTILALSNDLYLLLMGYSVGDDVSIRHQKPLSNDRGNPKEKTHDTKRRTDLLEDLIDEVINSNRRSDLLESQMPLIKGPLGPELRKEDPTTHSYAPKGFNCPQFQRDLMKKVSKYANSQSLLARKSLTDTQQEHDLRHLRKVLLRPSPRDRSRNRLLFQRHVHDRHGARGGLFQG
ncbi:MAG: hypothetical protein Q9225_002051, partial [Loekoesia sp. 1 TL-2023]